MLRTSNSGAYLILLVESFILPAMGNKMSAIHHQIKSFKKFKSEIRGGIIFSGNKGYRMQVPEEICLK